MSRKKVVKLIYCAFGVLAFFYSIFVVVYIFGDGYVGTMEAKYDLMRGHYRIQSFGLNPFMAYEEDVIKLYGIECIAVAGCVVNDLIIENVEAYNSVMRKAILEKFGIDIDSWKYKDEEAKSLPFHEQSIPDG